MKGEGGFTLVELLMALAAGSLLLASLGWLTGMLGSQVRRATAPDGFAQIAAMAPALTGLLQTARPVAGATAIDADAVHLEAEVDPPMAWSDQGPIRLGLTVTRDRDGEALDLELKGEDINGSPRSERRRLANAFKAIDIDVTRGERAGDPARLITLHFVGRNSEDWDLAVEPRLNAAGGCRFDPISMACRR